MVDVACADCGRLKRQLRYTWIWLGVLTTCLLAVAWLIHTEWMPEATWTQLGFLVAVGGLGFAYWTISHTRSANAIAIWTAIWERLQNDEVAGGR
jgi:hypothetical protein